MTNEELLRPRYKVIADYPNSPFPNNEILVFEEDELGYFFEWYEGLMPRVHNHMYESYFKAYPHLFKRLEWYEERNLEDLPLYVSISMTEYPVKVKKWAVEFGTLKAWEFLRDSGIAAKNLNLINETEYKIKKKEWSLKHKS